MDDLKLANFKGMLQGFKTGRVYGVEVGRVLGKLDVLESIMTYAGGNRSTLDSETLLKGIMGICEDYLMAIDKQAPTGDNSEYR